MYNCFHRLAVQRYTAKKKKNLLYIISLFSYVLNYLYGTEMYFLFYAARYQTGLLTMLYSNHRGIGDTSSVKAAWWPQRKGKSFFPQAIQVLKMLAAKIPMMSVIGLWISVLKLSFDFKAYRHNGHLGPREKKVLLPENMRSACHVSFSSFYPTVPAWQTDFCNSSLSLV